MYKIVICEDNDLQRDELKKFIHKIFRRISDKFEIFEFSSGEELLKSNILDIDLFLLDIKMNELTGIDVAEKIREQNEESEIIFVTSLVEYVQEGYKVRAYRYLLKPVKYEELDEIIYKCILDIIKKRDKFMLIKNRGLTEQISIESINYIEVIKRDISIYTDNNVYFTKKSLDSLEKELKIYNFFRCHKSYLINIKKINSISKNIVNINNQKIPISKYRIKELKTKLTYELGSVIC